jgi:hypothetical protein
MMPPRGSLFTLVRGKEPLQLEIPLAPGLEVRRFGHGKRRREARKKVAVVLAISHALGAQEALGCPDMHCPATLRLSIASSRTESSSAMNEVYGRVADLRRHLLLRAFHQMHVAHVYV